MMSEGAKVRHSRKPEAVRARILDAAQAEFMAEGFAGASTNRMLEVFGGSKPTMFRHFPTKRALFEGVVARIAGRWASQIDLARITSDDPAHWLRDFGGMALRWILTDENIFVGRMAIAEGAAFPGVSAIYRSLAVEPIEAALTDRLRSWTENNRLRCTDPHRDAVHFLDLTLSGMVSRRLYGVPIEQADALDEHVARCVALFLDGRQAG
jgi:AcrR family transcriptional regulator